MNVLGPSSVRQAVIAQASASPSVASVASVASDSGKRRVLITGGNTGIGFETAKALAHSHKIIVGARNEAKGKAAVAKLKDAVPGASCELAVFDLADLDSVSDFSKAMLDAGTPLDVLINNAGVMACPLSRTKQGFETQIGVNHLGHFLLTEELLPLIQAAGSNHGDARIVNLASSANYGGTINFDDLNWTKRQYSKWPAYCQSKLANVVRPKPVTTRPDSPRLATHAPPSLARQVYTYELDRRIANSGVTVNAVHPGVVATELGRYLFPSLPQGSEEQKMSFIEKAVAKLATLVLLTPARGAEASVFVASSPDAANVSGKYFDSVSLRPKESNKESYDIARQDRLTALSRELVSAYKSTVAV